MCCSVDMKTTIADCGKNQVRSQPGISNRGMSPTTGTSAAASGTSRSKGSSTITTPLRRGSAADCGWADLAGLAGRLAGWQFYSINFIILTFN